MIFSPNLRFVFNPRNSNVFKLFTSGKIKKIKHTGQSEALK